MRRQGAAAPLTVYVYRWNRCGRKGQRCTVTARGTMNSCAVLFEDGFSMVTSRNALKKDKTMTNAAYQELAGERLTREGFERKANELVALARKSGLSVDEIRAGLASAQTPKE